MKKTQCGCQDNVESGVEEQIASLGRQIRGLSRRFAEHLRLDPDDDGSRAVNDQLRDEQERIIGGREVDPGAFPECCLVGNTSGGGFLRSWFCTGTLIHPRVVVSAEHCIFRTVGQLSPNSIAIGVDAQSDVQPAHIVRVSRIIKHQTEDIALFILHQPAPVAPVQRATTAEVAAADRVELVGFGNTDPAGSVGFGTKRQVNVPMNVVRKSPKENLSQAEALLGFNSFTEFVAGRKGSRQDSCKGDSGGPAYVFVDNTRKLAGATSRATDEANDVCGDGGVYVRVDAVSDWIDEIIAALP